VLDHRRHGRTRPSHRLKNYPRRKAGAEAHVMPNALHDASWRAAKSGKCETGMIRSGYDREMARIFCDALVARGGHNGGNPDFPVEELKLIRIRVVWLRIGLIG
jgi:hypothetical protein